MQHMFQKLLKKHHDLQSGILFARLTGILTEMRTQAARHYSMEGGFFGDNNDLLIGNYCRSYTEIMDRKGLESKEDNNPILHAHSTATSQKPTSINITALINIVEAIGSNGDEFNIHM